MKLVKMFLLAGMLVMAGFGIVRCEGIIYHVEKIPYGGYLPQNKLTVVASFDGSYNLKRWEDILSFARENSIKFTFFISGVYFVPRPDKDTYVYPPNPLERGISDIGFGDSTGDVAIREQDVLKAIKMGHDVESHLNGHFDGTRWTEDAWRREFQEFNSICSFLPIPVRHVRFPLLAYNNKVFPVLAEFGIRSVTSVVENDYENFNRITIDYKGKPYTFLEFPIAYEHENKSKILLMDYNFYLYDESHHIDPEKSKDDMMKMYLDEAERAFKDKRPFFISHHFSNWNHAAYWDAMKQVLLAVKQKYSVEFITVSELYDLLNK